jgi:rod shape determining protein RodA
MSSLDDRPVNMSLMRKLRNTSWMLVVLIAVMAGIGFMMLYSAANGSIDPWVSRQFVRFCIGAALMFFVALVDIRVWMRLAVPIYAMALVLLVAVQLMGTVSMGAQRWVDLGIFNLQPSEIMKIALVLGLARYFHAVPPDEIGRLRWLIIPVAMIVAPAALVLLQPDLGTAALLILGGTMMFFLAGVRLWKFAVVIGGGLAMIPFAWNYLRGYQQERILVFFDPERDPLGAGYHILQSKIALGSGGIWGKGFLLGTQSHLNFLPEKQTDFIFTTLAEEFGLLGGLFLLALYAAMLGYGFAIGLRARSHFARLVAFGVTGTFFLYVFINVAMVMGLVPVVGVPLPLISYGGTAMVTILIGFGLLLSVSIHRDIQIPRRPGFEPN